MEFSIKLDKLYTERKEIYDKLNMYDNIYQKIQIFEAIKPTKNPDGKKKRKSRKKSRFNKDKRL
jgi:hypothetical protein